MAATQGQQKQIKDLLSPYSPAQVQALIESGLLTQLMQAPDLRHVDRAGFQASLSLFETPERIHRWVWAKAAGKHWPFTDQQLDEFDERMRALAGFRSTPARTLTVRIWLGDLNYTINELAGWLRETHNLSVSTFLKVDPDVDPRISPDHVRLADPSLFGEAPFIEPVVVNLVANRGAVPSDIPAHQAAGIELLAAAAIHVNYLPATYGTSSRTLPMPIMGQIQSRHGYGEDWEDWKRHLTLTYLDRPHPRRAFLTAHEMLGGNRAWCVPTVQSL